MDYVVRSNRRS